MFQVTERCAVAISCVRRITRSHRGTSLPSTTVRVRTRSHPSMLEYKHDFFFYFFFSFPLFFYKYAVWHDTLFVLKGLHDGADTNASYTANLASVADTMVETANLTAYVSGAAYKKPARLIYFLTTIPGGANSVPGEPVSPTDKRVIELNALATVIMAERNITTVDLYKTMTQCGQTCSGCKVGLSCCFLRALLFVFYFPPKSYRPTVVFCMCIYILLFLSLFFSFFFSFFSFPVGWLILWTTIVLPPWSFPLQPHCPPAGYEYLVSKAIVPSILKALGE